MITVAPCNYLRLRTPDNQIVFPDMFVGETVAHFGTHTFIVHVEQMKGEPGPFRTVAFDHIAITVADRPAARDFFHNVVGMEIVRDDPHQAVLTTGLTSLFLFGTAVAPLSDGVPSRWHHLGFVVDDLERCYHHLQAHGAELVSDFTLLERDERWSLYCHYRNGDVVFMIQFSEVRAGYRGVQTDALDFMYDYLRGRYGVRFVSEMRELYRRGRRLVCSARIIPSLAMPLRLSRPRHRRQRRTARVAPA